MEKNNSESARLATTALEYDEAFITTHTPSMVVTLDAGATSHMFGNRTLLSGYYPVKPSKIEVAAKDKPIYATARGTAKINGLSLHDILVSDQLGANLVSSGRLYDLGYEIDWGRTYAHVKSKQGEILFTFHRDPFGSRLWQRTVRLPKHSALFVQSKQQVADLWHQRLGHLHPTAVIRSLRTQGVVDVSLDDFSACDGCRMGKSIESPTNCPFHRFLLLYLVYIVT